MHCRSMAHQLLLEAENEPKARRPMAPTRPWFGVFFLVLLSQERKIILHPPSTIQSCLVMGSLAQVFAVPGRCSCCCCTVRQPRPSPSLRRSPLLAAAPPPQQICLLQICLGRIGVYPTYRLADRLGRSSALLSFGYDSQYFGISHIVVFVLC